MYCTAVWRCAKPPFAEHMTTTREGQTCTTPYYWPCAECWKARKWEGDKQFQEHVAAHYGYRPVTGDRR